MTEREPNMCVSLIETINANIDNLNLTVAQCREFVRNSLPVTEKPSHDSYLSNAFPAN